MDDPVVHCRSSIGSGEHRCLFLLWAPPCPGAVVRTAFFPGAHHGICSGRSGRPLREAGPPTAGKLWQTWRSPVIAWIWGVFHATVPWSSKTAVSGSARQGMALASVAGKRADKKRLLWNLPTAMRLTSITCFAIATQRLKPPIFPVSVEYTDTAFGVYSFLEPSPPRCPGRQSRGFVAGAHQGICNG